MISRFLNILLIVVGLLAPGGAGLFRVWVNQDAVQIGYDLSEETRRARNLAEHVRQLEIEMAAGRAPQRLSILAMHLGLAPARRIAGASPLHHREYR